MADVSLKTEITVDQIVQDFGDYYLDNGQNMDNLHMLPFESFGTKDIFTIIETDETILRESNVEVTEILQSYQDDFTPKGGAEFKPVQIPMFKIKIDQEFNPHKLQKTWLAFLTANKMDVTTWPFVKWFLESYIKKQTDEDLEMKAIYNGKFVQPVQGEPGLAIESMDGIAEVFGSLDNLTEIATGVIPVSNADFVTQVENFVMAIPEKFREMEMELSMSRTNATRFRKGVRDKYKTNYDPADIKNYRVADAENITVIGRASMMNKNKYFCTPKYNALLGVKGFENKNAFEVEKAKRKVAIYTEWWMGLGFINGELVFTNDQN